MKKKSQKNKKQTSYKKYGGANNNNNNLNKINNNNNLPFSASNIKNLNNITKDLENININTANTNINGKNNKNNNRNNVNNNNSASNSRKSYYNTLNLQDKIKSLKNQGYYPVGLDIIGFIKKMMEGTKIDASNNGLGTYKEIGEYVDEDYNTVVKRVVGIRDPILNKQLLPENTLTKMSRFNNIVNESKKYTNDQTENKVSLNGLIKMCRILYKHRKNDEQWFRVASLLKVMYNYLGEDSGLNINEFFSDNSPISYSTLKEIEELWKTIHIFMTPNEMLEFKSDMDFFKE